MSTKNTLIKLMLREASRVAKDHTLILSLLFAPIFYAFFYGSIYINKTEKEVPIIIVDNDHSDASRTFIRMINESQIVEVAIVTEDINEAKSQFLHTKVQGIIHIPKNFEADLKGIKGTDVKMFLNTSRFLPSNDINQTVHEIALIIGAGVRLKYYQMHGSNSTQSLDRAMPISIDDHTLFVLPSTYGGFLLPGLLLLILQQTFLIGMTESIAREREQKTVGDWLKQSGGNLWKSIWGKSLFFLILYAAYSLFFHVVNYHVLDLPINGSISLLVVLLTLFFLVLALFGTFFGTLFSKEIWALQFFAFSSYPIFLASGYSWPLFTLNPVIQAFAFILPTTPVLEAYIGIVYKNASIIDIQYNLAHLLLLGVCYGGLAWWRMKKLSTLEMSTPSNEN